MIYLHEFLLNSNEIKHLICKFMRYVFLPQKVDVQLIFFFFDLDNAVMVMVSTGNQSFHPLTPPEARNSD